MRLGGFSPLPCKLGGGTPRVKVILDSLNADRGTAFDAANSDTLVYGVNMAFARAISAAWGTNIRLGNLWIPGSCSEDVLERWEKILRLNPAPDALMPDRRAKVAEVLARFGQTINSDYLADVLTAALGDVFVAVEHIGYSLATIQVPDGTYPWGSVGSSPWSSTVAHILVQLQKPTGWSELEFYEAAGQVVTLLEPVLPVWATVTWYRPGPVSQDLSPDGPSAAGFYLNDSHNLDNEIFA